mmetsp:Transcript_9242/g.11244  ORF Transcript_9242/g.11244 Transcript_9242/m.11244 type:complete len:105 (+) Transcript_9242:500-814(+)
MGDYIDGATFTLMESIGVDLQPSLSASFDLLGSSMPDVESVVYYHDGTTAHYKYETASLTLTSAPDDIDFTPYDPDAAAKSTNHAMRFSGILATGLGAISYIAF